MAPARSHRCMPRSYVKPQAASPVIACRAVSRCVALALAFSLIASPVLADERPVCTDPPSDREVSRRLEIVREYIRQSEPPARRWYTTFMLLHATMAVGAGMIAIAADTNEGQRIDMSVNTLSSTLAVLSLVVASPPMMGAGGTVDAMPTDTPAARLRALREAEDILRREANAIDFAQGWLPTTGSVLYTSGAAIVLLTAFDRVSAAFTLAGGGAVLGLGRLLLRPMDARARWRRYSNRFEDAACEDAPAASIEPRLRIGLNGAGLGVSLTF